MSTIKRLCVFCGSNNGNQPQYKQQAISMGETLAKRNIELVYGGGKVGLMGAIANACLDKKGYVIGIIPGFLRDKEVGHGGVSELVVVNTMHERKKLMSDLSDGFILMPGGLGSFEEFFEVWTWAQLGIAPKPLGILNINGYYDQLLSFIKHANNEGFVNDYHANLPVVSDTPDILIDKMQQQKIMLLDKWEETQPITG